ncbi:MULTISPECIES: acetyl-CoA acetyltransferase [unclassified Nocardioides]|uniref:acetyl-CoA acetyltransferase n=1 Tax=unclassified Nocardioides TaxID=2615069 RepID=UPI0000EB60E2|nr:MULTISPECIES: acetyl-CoA acetyltransferase [unclassified Nocardioides]ABL80367.1 thiolase [Nocardioides sp. JS614]
MSTGVAVVGAAEADDIGVVPGKSSVQMHAEAAANALAHANLGLRDVDALFTCGLDFMPSLLVSEYLGLQPRYSSSNSIGGSSFVAHVHEAVLAIRSGRCEVALVTHGETRRSNRRRGVQARPHHFDPWLPDWQWERPYGVAAPPAAYALAATRHMHEYGTTTKHFAEIAVATRAWAALNPRAYRQALLTIDEVLAAPYFVYPFRPTDICLVTDAGGAVVLTSTARARDLGVPVVEVLGSAVAHTHYGISQMPDLTTTPAAVSGAEAYREAGIGPDDVDVAELYDSFTYTALVQLEDLGFCAKGEGGDFVSGQRTAPGGDFPLNTSGGGLSYTHPGMFGMFLLIEAVRQLRGECDDRQVPAAEVALVNGMGGYLSSSATAILGRR